MNEKPVNDKPRVSAELERWSSGEGEKTLNGLIMLFGRNSFALLFVLLLGVPALPLPTAGATHVFELVAILLALQMVAGRERIWLPQRWGALSMGGGKQQRFIRGVLKLIRWLERFSRPRLRFLFEHRLSDIAFGVLVILGSAAAFVAPPFSGLDTLPALGVVLLSLGVLLEDVLVVVLALVVALAGVALEVLIGSAAISGLSSIL
jgi:hypothetical protein